MAYENHLIDKRVVERNIAKGLVDPAVLKQQIASLPDAESNLVHVSVDNSNTAEHDRRDIYDDVEEDEDDVDESDAVDESDDDADDESDDVAATAEDDADDEDDEDEDDDEDGDAGDKTGNE